MSALEPPVIDYFGKLLGLLGSDQLGERAAAAAKATQFLAARGLSWFDVTQMLKHPPVLVHLPPPARPRAELLRPHQRRAMAMLMASVPWNGWERGFIKDMRARCSDLTDGQQVKFDQLCAKSSAWHARRERTS